MPSKNLKQHNLMAMVANDPKAAKRVGIPQSVGADYMKADKRRKFGSGGSDKAKINKQNTRHGKMDLPVASLNKYAGMAKGGDVKKEMKAAGIFAKAGEKKLAAHERREAMGKEKDTPAIAKKEMSALKKAKAPKDVMKYEREEHSDMGMKHGGKIKKYADGGMTGLDRAAAMSGRTVGRPAMTGIDRAAAMSGRTVGRPVGMKKGGSAKKYARGGGIESRGKTKGKFI